VLPPRRMKLVGKCPGFVAQPMLGKGSVSRRKSRQAVRSPQWQRETGDEVRTESSWALLSRGFPKCRCADDGDQEATPRGFALEPEQIHDQRGFFARTWCRRELHADRMDSVSPAQRRLERRLPPCEQRSPRLRAMEER
jgi:hypothetical protein